MSLPRWDDPKLKLGTMPRAALWLRAKVGEGNIFTKQQLRDAFPGVSQVDRRVRDLRDHGWVIHTSADDVSLTPHEQRFVRAGAPVWEPGARKKNTESAITARERMAAMSADGFLCAVCGIGGGETYVEPPASKATLFVTRKQVRLPNGQVVVQPVTECKRCRAGAPAVPCDVSLVYESVRSLDDVERQRFLEWAERGRRHPTPLDHAWSLFRRLPDETRTTVRNVLVEDDEPHRRDRPK